MSVERDQCWHWCPTCGKDWSHQTLRVPSECPARKLCDSCAKPSAARGVYQVRAPRLKRPRWRASLWRNGRRVNLGSFASKAEAVKAYEEAAR